MLIKDDTAYYQSARDINGRPLPSRGAIVAMSKRNAIGVGGKLPWHYSADLKRFKRRTINGRFGGDKKNGEQNCVIMGRLTWESIGAKALPGRRNIVISRTLGKLEGAECFADIDAAFAAAAEQNIWVIGGGQIYRACFSRLNFLDVTLVPDEIDARDAVTFPAIDPRVWRQCAHEMIDAANQLVNVQYVKAARAA